MGYFVDAYSRVLDEKGRIILPAKVRENLSNTVFITYSPSDKCLHLYTETEWEAMADKLRALPTTTDKNAAAFVRMFFGRATACAIDKQGRISIAQRFIDYAGLNKEIMLVGVNTRLEIWDADTWNIYQNNISEDVMVEGILQYGLNI
ncbi:MAG: division/cell wall cluster transcriptional repressor MraZ [Clostridia bacterium]|nr:division/cell wall cluster transcriptional repressor MraZ [Clostridia bacterium]